MVSAFREARHGINTINFTSAALVILSRGSNDIVAPVLIFQGPHQGRRAASVALFRACPLRMGRNVYKTIPSEARNTNDVDLVKALFREECYGMSYDPTNRVEVAMVFRS